MKTETSYLYNSPHLDNQINRSKDQTTQIINDPFKSYLADAAAAGKNDGAPKRSEYANTQHKDDGGFKRESSLITPRIGSGSIDRSIFTPRPRSSFSAANVYHQQIRNVARENYHNVYKSRNFFPHLNSDLPSIQSVAKGDCTTLDETPKSQSAQLRRRPFHQNYHSSIQRRLSDAIYNNRQLCGGYLDSQGIYKRPYTSLHYRSLSQSSRMGPFIYSNGDSYRHFRTFQGDYSPLLDLDAKYHYQEALSPRKTHNPLFRRSISQPHA